MHIHTKNIISSGLPLEKAQKAMIMVHGRGANAQKILSIADQLLLDEFALLAPQANQNTWYPNSFLAPKEQNEPGLSSALEVLKSLLEDVFNSGIVSENIYFVGFSQGACLSSEFIARNAQKYGGVFILSGGLIGDKLDPSNYQGDFSGTPILLGCSDIDSHVPLERVEESTKIFKEMGADVTERIYPDAPHSIFQDEIEFMNGVLSLK